MPTTAINITIYKWAGHWGPFKIKIPCGECTLTEDVVKDTIANELHGIPVKLEIHEWLSNWWKPFKRGGWHAPIVMVEDKVISQGVALNRGTLTEAVMMAHAKRAPITGNHLFGKASCKFCQQAKQGLTDANIEFTYHDVITNPRDLYEMIARVKPLIGPKTPLTVPQIWLNGDYVGGAEELKQLLSLEP